MSELIVACVRSGTQYPFDHVTTLRNRIERSLSRKYTLTCLTDQPERCTGVAIVDIGALNLPGRWGKMALFEPLWRAGAKVIYLDLDLDIIGDIAPLSDVPGEFAIAEGFNSSVMVLGSLMGGFLWNAFERRRELLMATHSGPSACIAELYPSAPFLPRLLLNGKIFPTS